MFKRLWLRARVRISDVNVLMTWAASHQLTRWDRLRSHEILRGHSRPCPQVGVVARYPAARLRVRRLCHCSHQFAAGSRKMSASRSHRVPTLRDDNKHTDLSRCLSLLFSCCRCARRCHVVAPTPPSTVTTSADSWSAAPTKSGGSWCRWPSESFFTLSWRSAYEPPKATHKRSLTSPFHS